VDRRGGGKTKRTPSSKFATTPLAIRYVTLERDFATGGAFRRPSQTGRLCWHHVKTKCYDHAVFTNCNGRPSFCRTMLALMQSATCRREVSVPITRL